MELLTQTLLKLIPLSAQKIAYLGFETSDTYFRQTLATYARRNPRASFSAFESKFTSEFTFDLAFEPTHAIGQTQSNDDYDCLIVKLTHATLTHFHAEKQGLLKRLNSNACVIFLAANASYWQGLKQLLSGQGLAHTHKLSVLGRSECIKYCSALGLHASDLLSVAGQPLAPDVKPMVTQLLQGLGITASPYEADVSQAFWCFRATRTPIRPLLIHAKPHRPLGGMSDVRVELPLKALLTEPGVRLGHIGQNLPNLIAKDNMDNLFIWQRPLSTKDSRAIVERFATQGVKTIIEFDDEPSIWPENVADQHKVFALAAATQTSTPVMYDRFKSLGANCNAFDNGIYELPPTVAPSPRGVDGKVNLFFGALNRQADWQPYMAALNQVLLKFDEQVHVQVVHDQAFFNALKNTHKTFEATCNYDRFHQLLQHSDIAWLPLNDTPINRCKSDLKFVESAAHGVCVIASHIVYGASVQHGVTGMLYQDVGSFQLALTDLLTHPDLRLNLGNAARQYVANERMLAYLNPSRLAWYRSLFKAPHTPTIA